MTEFTVQRNYFRGAGHYGTPMLKPDEGYDVSIMSIIGRDLGEGSRIRVTVEVLKEVPVQDSRVNSYGHGVDGPSPWCTDCIAQVPDGLVILWCGCAEHVRVWEREGKPETLFCEFHKAEVTVIVPEQLP